MLHRTFPSLCDPVSQPANSAGRARGQSEERRLGFKSVRRANPYELGGLETEAGLNDQDGNLVPELVLMPLMPQFPRMDIIV